MILATHALGGTVAALVFRSNPLLAFAAAFLSHFTLDAIPHWDYPVRSLDRSIKSGNPIRKLDGVLLGDLARTGLDFFVGAGLSFLLAMPADLNSALIVGLGVLGGVLPDFLQLVYFIVKAGAILKLQQFHVWIHARDRRLKELPAVGIPLQIAIAAFLGWLITFHR